MTKKIIFILILFSFQNGFAQSVKIDSLFTSDAFIPYMQIPFRITAPNIPESQSSFAATLLDDTDHVCHLMQDPYIPKNFLLRCTSPATVRIKFEIRATTGTQVTYGPIQIKELTDTVLVDPQDAALQKKISLGKALFLSNCIACHNAQSLRDKTAAQIKTNIIAQKAMQIPVLQGLTSAQLEDIATYLRNLASP